MAWLKKWWWTIVLGVAVVGLFLWLIFRKDKKTAAHSNLVQKAKSKIVEAETDALIEKTKAKVHQEEELKKLEEISRMEGGVERRKELADFLDKNL